MMIYAILAVEYFAPLGQEFGTTEYMTYMTFDATRGLNHTISAETIRGSAAQDQSHTQCTQHLPLIQC